MARIDHSVCLTTEAVNHRIVTDMVEIEAMKRDGHPVIARCSYYSDILLGGTGECHCLPIFSTDKLEDIVNRYMDFFPKDFQRVIDMVEAKRQTLYNSSGMSQFGRLMAFGSIPEGLRKMLDIWAGGDFMSPESKRRNLDRLFGYVGKLRIKGVK